MFVFRSILDVIDPLNPEDCLTSAIYIEEKLVQVWFKLVKE